MRRKVALVLLLSVASCMTEGKLLPEEKIESRCLQTTRTIRIYLPPSYERERKRRYPVLYLHDGQNVFTSAGRDCCFGWGSWNLDQTVTELGAAHKMREIIMVAVDNGPSRYQEYRGPNASTDGGATDPARQAAAKPNRSRFEAYAGFLIQELKPKIDREYRTLKTAANTGVMGSSLGGICSIALAWQYPKSFGRAASLSGSFQIEKKYFLERVLRTYQQNPKPVRFYLDTGTIDFTGDDDGRKNTEAVVASLRRIGWKDGKNLQHFVDENPRSEAEMEQAGLRRDKWHEARSSQHNEFYWRLRAWRALTYLFPPEPRE